MSNEELKKLPPLLNDDQAEREVDEIDLSGYDLSGFKSVRFELKAKDEAVHLRLPAALLKSVKDEAARRKMPYSRFIRMTLEHALKPS